MVPGIGGINTGGGGLSNSSSATSGAKGGVLGDAVINIGNSGNNDLLKMVTVGGLVLAAVWLAS